MRNDHVWHRAADGDYPTPEELTRYMAHARRMRSEAVYEYLARAAAWIRDALRPTRTPRGPVGQCC